MRYRTAHALNLSYHASSSRGLPRREISFTNPFMGRGTTLLESILLGRLAVGCDINPLSAVLLTPRLNPPTLEQVRRRLYEINWKYNGSLPEDLLAFYHPRTLEQICALRDTLRSSTSCVDGWLRMVATNRLTGHSKGFFSVYTLPPNQAVSVERQRRINEQRKQSPDARDVATIILHKSRSLLSKISEEDRKRLSDLGPRSTVITGSCDETPAIADESVALVVTSPPFLDVVNYEADNWLRCWFNHIDPTTIKLWMFKRLDDWYERMTKVFQELCRILKKNGFVAFEVGEVRGGKLKLEDVVVPAAERAGLNPVIVLINQQEFTKTSNCWGISNMSKGTNTNRVVLLQKRS
jgi:hypothetical protein